MTLSSGKVNADFESQFSDVPVSKKKLKNGF